MTAVSRFVRLLLSGLLLCAVSACSEQPKRKKVSFPDVPLRVVVTTTQSAEMTRRIGGRAVDVVCLVKPGQNPHGYVPPARERGNMHTADLVILNGLGLEAGYGETVESLSAQGAEVVELASVIPPQDVPRLDGTDGPGDPHLWMDPLVWKQCTVPVESALVKLWPDAAEYFQTRAHALRIEYERDASWGAVMLKKVQPEHRVILSSHDSFAWFARSMKFETRALGTAAGEISPARSQAFAEFAKSRGLKSVFPDSSSDQAQLMELAVSLELKLAAPVYVLSLGAEGKEEQGAVTRYQVDTCSGAWRMMVESLTAALVVD